MEFVPTTVLALLAVLVLLARPAHRGLWAFMVLTPFGAAAAFNLPVVGGASVGVMDVGVLAVFAAVVLSRDGFARFAGSMRPGRPGFCLALLGVFAIFSALAFPQLFAGQTEVFAIARNENQSRLTLVPLQLTTGNLTQLFRFSLNVIVFLAFDAAFRFRPEPKNIVTAIFAATVVHVTLGVVDVTSVLAGFGHLLDSVRTANYSMLAGIRLGGLVRMVGGFPEASSFGYYSLGLFGFWLQYWIVTRDRPALLLTLLSAAVLVLSTSSGTFVAAGVFLIVGGVITMLRGLQVNVSRTAMALGTGAGLVVLSAILMLFAGYQLFDPVTQFLDQVLFDKAASFSAQERASWNTHGLQNFRETWGMGAGLGSARASNWIIANLGSFGLIGTGLYIIFLAAVFKLPAGTQDLRRNACINGLKSACLAMLMSAMLTAATPDLGVFFFALAGLASGLSRGGEIESRA